MDLAMLTTVLVRAFLVVTMISIGLRLSDGRPAALPRGRRLVAGVLVANLVLVPLVGLVVVGVAGLASGVAIGILATAVSPAGSLGPKLVQVARGDLRSGVVATFVLSILATVTVAPSIALGQRLLGLDEQTSPIDPATVVVSLAVFQLAPTLLGVAIVRQSPGFARRIVEPLTRASSGLIVAIIVVAVADTADELVRLGPVPVIAMLLIASAASVIGWFVGGPDRGVQRASAIITAQRSPGLALLVVAGPGHAVETATVAAFALVLLVVNAGVAAGLRRAGGPLRLVGGRGAGFVSNDRA